MRTRLVLLATLLAFAPAACRRNPSAPKNPTAARLDILAYPQGEQQAGVALAPTIEVAVRSQDGRTVTDGSFTVTMSIVAGTGTSGATLGGTVTRTTNAGVATFDDLVIQTAGSGYRLVATASALQDATTNPFTVKAAAASKLAFATQPSTTVAGTTFPNTVRVRVTDAYGNLAESFNGTVTIAIEGVMPAAGDTTVPLRFTQSGSSVTPVNPLAGTLTVQNVAGIATFADLRPRTSGDYDVAANLPPRLVATSAGLTSATSDRFTVTPAPASKVWVSVPPCSGAGCAPPFPPTASQQAGVAFVVSVYLLDSLNNRTNTGNNAMSLQLGNNPGGALFTSNPITPTQNGRATFQVTVSNAGSGYTIVAASTGLTTVASYPFDVTPAASLWVARDSLPEVRNSMFAAESGGRIYVSAGSGGFPTFYNSTRVYDPATNQWTSRASSALQRAFSATNSAVVNGVLYLVAGNPYGSCTPLTESYIIATDTWDPRASAPRERCHSIAVSYNGQVYVIGGWNTSSTVRYSEVDVFNPPTNSWSAGVPLAAGTFRGGMASVVTGGKLYLIGGTISTGDACTNTVLVFDFAANTWGSAASMSVDRCGPAATVAANGRIYVAGGGSDAGTALSTVESYDPATNTWRAEPAMSTARQAAALVRVADWIYAIGGYSGSTVFRTVEALQVP